MPRSINTLFFSTLFIFCAAVHPGKAISAPTGYSNNEVSPPLLTAGIFRIESERSYKLSLQVALGILNTQSISDRDQSLMLIARARKDLAKVTDKTSKTTKAFSRVNAALDDQMNALPKLTASTASATYDINEDLLNKLNFLSFALEAETNDTASRIVGLALRQASLAQRMAKIVLLRSVDKSLAAKQGLQVDLAQSIIEFTNGLALLTQEAGSDRLLKDRVVLAQSQWVFYQTALAPKVNSSNNLRDISTTSDRIAELMVEIVRLGYALPPDPGLYAGR
ncbi:MAG: hypothetical protein Q7U12_12365 [Undibacterium sp.]|nr:hypothetical protein [Undibacterium sp.]